MAEKEYIDLDTPLEMKAAWGSTYKPYTSTLRELLDVNHIPYTAADARPVVRGEFVRCGDGKGVPYMCSHCGRTTPANMVEIWGVNYCPNCGADMRKEGVRPLRKCKLYKDCEYRTIWNCCCEDCNMWE